MASVNLIDDYFRQRHAIYEAFGYVEQWRVLPLDDAREYFWAINDDDHPHTIRYAKTEEILRSIDGEYYESQVYRGRHMDKSLWKHNGMTMIAMDTNCDFNVLLSVFDDNKKREWLDEDEELDDDAD